MAIYEHGGGDGTGDGSDQPVQRGERVTSSNTLSKFIDQLPNNGRGFLVVKPNDYPSFQLRSSRTTKIYQTKSAKELTSCTRADGDYVKVFIFPVDNYSDEDDDDDFDYRKMFSELTGAVKELAIEFHKKNAAMSASWFADKGVLKYPDKKSGKKLTSDKVSERYNQGTSKLISINGADEQAGADIIKNSAAAAVAISAVMAATTKGKSLFKDPDTLVTVKKGYTRILNGKKVEMPNVPVKEVKYTKRSAAETKKLHSQSTAVKKKFREDLAKDPEKVKQMKKLGISDAEIKVMKDRGLAPKGYEVHHKLPLDDGGTNDTKNLILTKKSPFHSAFTAEQKTLTGHLKEGETAIINFPVPKGSIYTPI